MVGWSKLCVTGHLTCKHTACQRYTCQDANLAFAGSSEELLGRLETEHVENNLDALQVWVGDRLESLVYTLYADTIKADLALLYQVVEDTKDFRHIVDLVWGAVELKQVECLHLQVLQAAFDKAGQVLAVLTFCELGIAPPSRLLRNNNFPPGHLRALRNQLSFIALPKKTCRINEGE